MLFRSMPRSSKSGKGGTGHLTRQDGYCYNGKYCNEKTINYVSKYMTKKDEDNPEYTGKVLCSPGLGAGYVKRIGKRHEWKGEDTKEDYYTRQGTCIALPKYYKYKLFTEEQREQLWIYREEPWYRDWETDRKSTRLNSSHRSLSRMPSSA